MDIMVCFSPAEALWYFSEAIHRKQEGRVAVATKAAQEVARSGQSLLGGRGLRHHGDGVKQEVLQVVSQLLVGQELQIWPTVVG